MRHRIAVLAAGGMLLLESPGLLAQTPNTREEVSKLLTAVSYGVPTSPAFALIGADPEEVVHISRPSDLQGTVTNWFNGARFGSGVALDWRPFGAAGSLSQYRANAGRRTLWRSVVAIGTADASDENSDVLIGAGVRIPLLDRGDPRLDRRYEAELDSVHLQALRACPPKFDASTQTFAVKDCLALEQLPNRVAELQESFALANWNRPRLDAGLAYSLRAQSAHVSFDSLASDRAGFWLAGGMPLGARAQLTVSGKASWADVDSVTQESSRYVAGARSRWFPRSTVGISLEGARIWTDFSDNSKDDEWTHLALGAEISLSALPLLKNSWLTLAYGGDVGKEGEASPSLSIRYAIHQNRLIKR
jgi:hypothetical protein